MLQNRIFCFFSFYQSTPCPSIRPAAHESITSELNTDTTIVYIHLNLPFIYIMFLFAYMQLHSSFVRSLAIIFEATTLKYYHSSYSNPHRTIQSNEHHAHDDDDDDDDNLKLNTLWCEMLCQTSYFVCKRKLVFLKCCLSLHILIFPKYKTCNHYRLL